MAKSQQIIYLSSVGHGQCIVRSGGSAALSTRRSRLPSSQFNPIRLVSGSQSGARVVFETSVDAAQTLVPGPVRGEQIRNAGSERLQQYLQNSIGSEEQGALDAKF